MIQLTENEIRERRLAFLNDMLSYYEADPAARRNINHQCKYAPIKDTSEGCAIGRKLPLPLAQELDKFYQTGVGNLPVFEKLPEELQILGQDFLVDMQNLHDNDVYWDNDLYLDNDSERAEEIKRIKEKWLLNSK